MKNLVWGIYGTMRITVETSSLIPLFQLFITWEMTENTILFNIKYQLWSQHWPMHSNRKEEWNKSGAGVGWDFIPGKCHLEWKFLLRQITLHVKRNVKSLDTFPLVLSHEHYIHYKYITWIVKQHNICVIILNLKNFDAGLCGFGGNCIKGQDITTYCWIRVDLTKGVGGVEEPSLSFSTLAAHYNHLGNFEK